MITLSSQMGGSGHVAKVDRSERATLKADPFLRKGETDDDETTSAVPESCVERWWAHPSRILSRSEKGILPFRISPRLLLGSVL